MVEVYQTKIGRVEITLISGESQEFLVIITLNDPHSDPFGHAYFPGGCCGAEAFSNDNYILGLEVNLQQFVICRSERQALPHVRNRLSGCYIMPRPTRALWVDIFMFRNDGLSQLQLHRGRSNTEVV